MKALLKSSVLREVAIFAALLSLAMLAYTFFAHTGFAATSLIDPSDNPSAIAAATDNETSFKALAQTILNFALSFLGFVATIMVIYGGVLYVTSAGDTGQVDKAKNILLYSVVGIVLILLSFAIVSTVLGAATSSSSTSTTTSSSSSIN